VTFRDFRLSDLKKKFALTTREAAGLFARCAPVEPSAVLLGALRRGIPLGTAIGNEKARSEMIVAPVLLELKELAPSVSIFSGVELTGDVEAGLSGICDFLVSRSTEQIYLSSPVVAVVEAKKEDMAGGLGQCLAEMISARMFNEREATTVPIVYGVVTTGTNWRFLSLEGSTVSIDLDDYSIAEPGRVLGILLAMATGATITAPATGGAKA